MDGSKSICMKTEIKYFLANRIMSFPAFCTVNLISPSGLGKEVIEIRVYPSSCYHRSYDQKGHALVIRLGSAAG